MKCPKFLAWIPKQIMEPLFELKHKKAIGEFSVEKPHGIVSRAAGAQRNRFAGEEGL